MNTSVTIRQNFHDEVEASINRQVNVELKASYIYQSMVIFIFLFPDEPDFLKINYNRRMFLID